MSDLYSTLHVSPRKKRCPPEFDDDLTSTPKRLRTAAPPTPPATASRKGNPKSLSTPLDAQLTRLNTLQTCLQNALSHALATCAVSPSSDTGLVRNVLNNFSLTTYNGLSQFDLDDLKRLCWIWEWNGLKETVKNEDETDNPFLDSEPVEQPKDWTRGGMGIVISPTTHHAKAGQKRVTAYGIGVEVEMDIDKDMGAGMAAVARWTAGSALRCKEFKSKLEKWTKLHIEDKTNIRIPFANIPALVTPLKPSTLTRTLASASPKSLSPRTQPEPPASPSRSPVKRSAPLREFAVPPSSKTGFLFPQTPSKRGLFTPATPSSSGSRVDPATPVHQRGRDATTVPQTPTSSRRQALYDRVRERSLSPSKPAAKAISVGSSKMTKDQLTKMGQEELRRRCLLGRLDGIAESVWMLFSAPSSTAALTTRKRRALPLSSVATAIAKSSPVPISSAEANESLTMLTNLCPFFLKPLNISGEEWLEMPAPIVGPTEDSKKLATPPSPGKFNRKNESAQELITRSPRRVKKEVGGLREVRQIIEREMQLQD